MAALPKDHQLQEKPPNNLANAFDKSTTVNNEDDNNDDKKSVYKQDDNTDIQDDELEAFSLTTVKGDLFSCPQNASMAHCVSRDLAMGKGIAVLFKKRFGHIQQLKSLVFEL